MEPHRACGGRRSGDPAVSDFQIVDENLQHAMRFFGEATGAGEVRPLDGGVAMYSGLDYGVFNIALLTRPVSLRDGGLEKRLSTMARFFRERTLRWSAWVCEDLLDSDIRKRERQIFSDFGMRSISSPPGMSAPALLPPQRPLPSIECRPVADAATRAAFAEITSVSFDIPYSVAHAVYSRERAWKGEYQGFVGLSGGRAVSAIAIVAAASAVGVYSLGTLPLFRRHGYGEALLRAAVAEVQAHTGLDRLVLQSTEAGYGLYRRMGFQDTTKFNVYLTK